MATTTVNPGILKSTHDCVWCGRNFDEMTKKGASTTRRQVIWVRMWVKLAGELFKVRGAVCGTCRNELSDIQVSPMALQG